MIYLKYDIENDIVVTLSESIASGTTAPVSGSTGSTYTLILTNLQTQDITTYNLNDISPNTERYNEFKLSIDSSLPSGYYSYAFRIKNLLTNEYEGNVLEIGKCLVDLPVQEKTIYSGNNNETYVYKG